LVSASSEYGEHDECPSPQSADWVDNGEGTAAVGQQPRATLTPSLSCLCCLHTVYLSHYTFVWADLASELAPYWDRNRQSGSEQQRTFDPQEEVDNPRDVHRSPGPMNRRSSKKQAGAKSQAVQSSKELGARPQSANSSTADSGSKAHLAYVDSPKFLFPTGVHESGEQQAGVCSGHSSGGGSQVLCAAC
jgi:hypothetical protein